MRHCTIRAFHLPGGAMRGLKGRTAIVTGGAAGIGAAIAERFRQEGTEGIVVDLNAKPAVDITDYEAVKRAVAQTGGGGSPGKNAGWGLFPPVLHTNPAFAVQNP